MIDHDKNYCPICDSVEDNCEKKNMISEKEIAGKRAEHEEVSFAVLLALVPAMTMTLFNLLGLI